MRRAGVKLAGVAGMMLFLALAPASSQAALAYWSFNANTLTPDQGSATMAVKLDGFGFLWTSYGIGTTLNAEPGFLAGSGVSDIDVGSGFASMEITMSGLDFTGQSNVKLFFATRSTAVFTLGEFMQVDYDTGSGFTGALSAALPDASWSLRGIDFGSALDNQANVSIRIGLYAVVDVLEVAEFDNIVLIPEPSTWSLLLVGVGSLGLVARCRYGKA